MSAFVVEYKTINRIVSKLRAQVERGGEWEKRFLLAPLLEAAEVDANGVEPLQDLGMALLAANVDAVEQRYPGSKELPGRIDETLLGYSYRQEDNIPLVWALKSLRCLHYQMAEGDVPERPLYKALEALSGQWAMQIVRELPEYDAAPGW
ncbi:hypothetical protein LCGC14_1821260 [marine sediment metagenome]|uniref:Uncharacterized protein n=1 Tax=marine sediment metagenome TaxID=412755 RepID=A0A0F9GIX4_9ZZZZ